MKNSLGLMPRGYAHILDRTKANEKYLSQFGELFVEHAGKRYKLTGVNDLGILYWTLIGSKKQVFLPEYHHIDDLLFFYEAIERMGEGELEALNRDQELEMIELLQQNLKNKLGGLMGE